MDPVFAPEPTGMAALWANVDWQNLCPPVYISFVTTAIEIVLILSVKGTAGVTAALYSLLFGLLTSYTINCLCGGECTMLAWVWSLLPLMVTTFGLLRELVRTRPDILQSTQLSGTSITSGVRGLVEKMDNTDKKEGFHNTETLYTGKYPHVFKANQSGLGPCAIEGCKCGCREGGKCTCGCVDGCGSSCCGGKCNCGSKCTCGSTGSGFCQVCEGEECCPPGKRNLDPVGSAKERQFYRPRESLNYRPDGHGWFYKSP